jgi:hypothetical protein
VDSAAVGTPPRSDPTCKKTSVLRVIISAIVVGLIIRALGRLVLPGRQALWCVVRVGVVVG